MDKLSKVCRRLELAELIKKKSILETASNALHKSNWSAADRIAHTQAISDALDKVAQLEFAKKEGMEEGMKKTAKKFLAQGISIEKICEVTGLKKEDIVEELSEKILNYFSSL